MLNKQLSDQIEQEAKTEAMKLTGRVPIFRYGYEDGWYDAGEKYAEKWQSAEARAERAEKALTKIVSLSCNGSERNTILEMKSIASMAVAKNHEALTPKTGEDDRTNE